MPSVACSSGTSDASAPAFRHPCFDGHEGAKGCGRVHVPLVGKCNIGCGYCTRKSWCANESRPGVAARIVTVEEGLALLGELGDTDLRIVGLSGPGDPFADPEKLLAFMREVRRVYGRGLELCVSTNGLVLHRYIDALVELEVGWVTLTLNALRPETASQIVDWVYVDGEVVRGLEAGRRLVEGQRRSLEAVLGAGLQCKVNTVVIPEVNQFEIPELMATIGRKGSVRVNLIPLIPVAGSRFEHAHTLSPYEYTELSATVARTMRLVTGCKKCRADAVHVCKKPERASTVGALPVDGLAGAAAPVGVARAASAPSG